MIDNLLSGGVAGVTIVTVLKAVEALTSYFNSKKSGSIVKTNGKCVEHENMRVQVATIVTRQETIMGDITEMKSDVKEIFRTLLERR